MDKADLIAYSQLIQSWVIGHWAIVTALITGITAVWGALVWGHRIQAAFAKVTQVHAAAFYSELDRIYFDLLRLAIEHPHLRTPQRIGKRDDLALKTDYDPYPDDPVSTEEQKATKARKVSQYDAYAFMVWNFVETIHDRCQEYPQLLGTWATIVAAENRVHRGWFLKQMRVEEERRNQPDYEPSDKFCKEFQVFVHDKNFMPAETRGGKPTYPDWSYEGRSEFKVKPDFDDIGRAQDVRPPRQPDTRVRELA